MKSRIVLIAVPLIAIVAGACFYQAQGHAAGGSEAIQVSGNIEVTDAEVSFKMPGRMIERKVSEGERVEKDQVVAVLDCAELERQVGVRAADVEAATSMLAELEAGTRPEQIRQAEAGVEAGQAALNELLAGARPQELEAARSDVRAAQAEADRVTADFNRVNHLFDQKVVSAQMRDSARAAHDVAMSRLKVAQERLALAVEGPRAESIERARAMLRQAEETFNLAKEGPRKETIDQARARVKQATEGLEAAKIQLANGTLKSPLSGVVLSDNVEDGEYVTPGMPIITVADLEHSYLRSYINETDLGKVKIGQEVEVTTDTYPGKKYKGVISFISPQAEFTPKSVQTEKERVKLVYRVKIDIADTSMELKPGMPADGVILTAAH